LVRAGPTPLETRADESGWMQPIVIPTRCRGNKLCERLAPEVFQVDDLGMAWVVDENPPEELYGRVRDAVYRCPAKALMVDDG
jgi:ferredoxin